MRPFLGSGRAVGGGAQWTNIIRRKNELPLAAHGPAPAADYNFSMLCKKTQEV